MPMVGKGECVRKMCYREEGAAHAVVPSRTNPRGKRDTEELGKAKRSSRSLLKKRGEILIVSFDSKVC